MEQKLKLILADILNVDAGKINDSLSINSAEEWDSLKHIEIITAIEEGFEMDKLKANEIVTMISVAEIKKVLRGKGIDL